MTNLQSVELDRMEANQ